MTQELGQNQRFGRREFFRRYGPPATLVVGSALGGGIAARILLPRESVKTVTVEKEAEGKIYTSGETIETPAGPVKINGWRLLFDQEALKKYAKDKDATVNFQLSQERGGLQPSIWISQFGSGFSYGAEVEENGVKYLSMLATPPYGYKGLAYLTFTEERFDGKDFKPVRIRNYGVNPQYFTHKEKENGRPLFYSEEDLDPETKKRIYETLNVFGKFAGYMPPLYIFKSDHKGGSFSASRNELAATLGVFKNPDYEDEGFLVLFHEAAHALHHNFITNVADQLPDNALFEAYRKVVEGAASVDSTGVFRIPMPSFGLFGVPKNVDNNPYFNIFDESHYVPVDNREPGVEYGHPYSNYTELFASIMTVMRFYPDQFIEKYSQADPSIQKTTKEVVKSVFNILRWYRKLPEEHEADLKELFPRYNKIASTFDLRN